MNPLQPCIFEAPHQKREVARLVQHCKDLDGTEVTVLRWKSEPHGMKYPEICNAAFLWSARQMLDAPAFVWLETDSIPLHPGWLGRLAVGYWKSKKPFMLTIDQQTPHDLISGIGVYDPKAVVSEMPDSIAGDGWDGWLLRYRAYLLHRSELIQHSYGCYNSNGNARNWEFPADRWIIRPSAQIFHKDKHQGLIQTNNLWTHNKTPTGTSSIA